MKMIEKIPHRFHRSGSEKGLAERKIQAISVKYREDMKNTLTLMLPTSNIRFRIRSTTVNRK